MTLRVCEERSVFDRAIAQSTDPDQIARLELCREYFTNPDFRRALHNEAARINGVPA